MCCHRSAPIFTLVLASSLALVSEVHAVPQIADAHPQEGKPSALDESAASKAQQFVDSGKAAYQAKNYAAAVENYSEALKLVPSDPRLLYNRGIAYYKLDDLEHALADFTKSVEIAPTLYFAWMNRGNIFSRRKQFAEAVRDYDKAIAVNANDFLVWFNRGVALGRLGDNEKALRDLNEALRLQPYDGASYSARADIYFALGDFREAAADYRRTLTIKPGNPHAEQRLRDMERVVSGGVPGIIVQQSRASADIASTIARLAFTACFENGDKEYGLRDLAQKLDWRSTIEQTPAKNSDDAEGLIGSWAFENISGSHVVNQLRNDLSSAIHICNLTSKLISPVDTNSVQKELEGALKTKADSSVTTGDQTIVTYWAPHTANCETRTTLKYSSGRPILKIRMVHGRLRSAGKDPYLTCASCE